MPICSHCRGESLLGRVSYYRNSPDRTAILRNLTTSNTPATPLQVAHVKKSVFPDISMNLKGLDKKIAELRSAIDILKQEKARLTDVRDYYNTLISPFRLFPIELLSEIIYHARSTDAMDVDAQQWRFARVSRAWRAASLSCHSMWTRMVIEFPGDSSGRARQLRRLNRVLARSGSLPLDINVFGDVAMAKGGKVLDALFAESSRWENFVIDVDGVEETVFLPLQNRLQSLRSLSIALPRLEASSGVQTRSLGGFSSCPALRRITYTGGRNPVDIPCDKITTFETTWSMEDWEYDGLNSLLSACTSIHTFVSNVGILDAGYPIPSFDTKVLCGAKIVRLDNTASLQVIEFPDIEELVVQSTHEQREDEWIIRDLARVVWQSGYAETITCLRLQKVIFTIPQNDFSSSTDPVVYLLDGLFNLTTLDLVIRLEFRLDRSTSPCDAASEILFRLASPTFLPELTSFSLECSHCTFINEEPHMPLFGSTTKSVQPHDRAKEKDFVQSLQLRSKGSPHDFDTEKLKKFTFHATVGYRASSSVDEDADFEDLLLREDVDALQALADAGMELSVRFTSYRTDVTPREKVVHLAVDSVESTVHT